MRVRSDKERSARQALRLPPGRYARGGGRGRRCAAWELSGPGWVYFEVLESRVLLSDASPPQFDVALIDTTLPQSQTLINAALGETRVITYDGAHDSPEEVLRRVIAVAGNDARDISSLSIFSHGAPGRFELGNQFIAASNVRQTAELWKELRGAFASGATLQIYGCDTADGISGQKLLDRLSGYTGVTVFGSTNISGYGGDWTLESESKGGASKALTDVRMPLDLAELSGYRGQLIWTGATSGTTNDSAHDYNNPANWANGVIDDSFSGVTFSANTTLYFSADRTTGAGGVNLNYSGNFDLSFMSNSTTARSLVLGGGISGDFGGPANRTVTFGDAGNNNILTVDLGGGAKTFTVTSSGDTLVLANTISDGSLIESGAGVLVLSGTNTFSGGLILSSGTLDLNNASALGSGTFTLQGGTIDNTSGSAITLSTNNTQTWSGSFTFAGSNNLNLGTGAVTLTTSPTLTTSAATLTVGGIIGDGGAGLGLIKAGIGTLLLSANNTYTGQTPISSGVLQLGSAASLAQSTVSIGVNNGLAFSSGIAAFTIGGLSGNKNLALADIASAAIALTVGNNNAAASFSGILSGTGSLIKIGAATQSLTGNNTFSGGTIIDAGILSFANNSLGGGNIIFGGNATLQWNGANTQDISSKLQAIASGITATFDTNGNSVILASTLSGAGSVVATGAGTLTLSAANTFSGGLTLASGTLNINNAAALGTGAFTIDAGTTINNTTTGPSPSRPTTRRYGPGASASPGPRI